MPKYVHSEAFNRLKSTKEEISANLSSSQYLSTLDHLIWKALSSVMKASPMMFRNYYAKCVAHQSLSPNTKFSPDTKAELPIFLFNALTAPDDTEERFRKLSLNRGLLFGLNNMFLAEVEDYLLSESGVMAREHAEVVKHVTVEKLQCPDPDSLYVHCQDAAYWNDRAQWFKSLIVQKYIRMALLEAQRTYVRYGNKVSLDDMTQIYVMIVSKAIDRCSSNLGVITSFVRSWLKSARSIIANQAAYRKEESLDSLIEDHGDSFDIPVEPDTLSENLQHVAYIAKQIDAEGLVRTSLGIPQHVSLKYQDLLRDLAVRKLT